MKNIFTCWVAAGIFASPSYLRLSAFICGSNCFFQVHNQRGHHSVVHWGSFMGFPPRVKFGNNALAAAHHQIRLPPHLHGS
jgi:hypothetical protein